MKRLWKVRYRMSDGAVTDVQVTAEDRLDAERKSIGIVRQRFGAVEIAYVASWVFSPTKRWYHRAGCSMRNAVGAMCCQAWLATVPWLVEWLRSHPIALVLMLGGILGAVFLMLLRAGEWLLSQCDEECPLLKNGDRQVEVEESPDRRRLADYVKRHRESTEGRLL